jgi:hypothetical protein
MLSKTTIYRKQIMQSLTTPQHCSNHTTQRIPHHPSSLALNLRHGPLKGTQMIITVDLQRPQCNNQEVASSAHQVPMMYDVHYRHKQLRQKRMFDPSVCVIAINSNIVRCAYHQHPTFTFYSKHKGRQMHGVPHFTSHFPRAHQTFMHI